MSSGILSASLRSVSFFIRRDSRIPDLVHFPNQATPLQGREDRDKEQDVTGQIRCFFPGSRRGILYTRNGEEFVFMAAEGVTDLQGGDCVEFELAGANGSPAAVRIIGRHRWVDTLNNHHRALVNEFHNTIQIQA